MWNEYYVNELLREAENALRKVGAKQVKMKVPGASELVSGARAMLRKHKPDAVIVLGVVIRGASDSYEFTCTALMEGLTQLNAMQDVPVVHSECFTGDILGSQRCDCGQQLHRYLGIINTLP